MVCMKKFFLCHLTVLLASLLPLRNCSKDYMKKWLSLSFDLKLQTAYKETAQSITVTMCIRWQRGDILTYLLYPTEHE